MKTLTKNSATKKLAKFCKRNDFGAIPTKAQI